MNKPLSSFVISPDINLGDTSSVKVGDQVAIIRYCNGEYKVEPRVFIAKEILDNPISRVIIASKNNYTVYTFHLGLNGVEESIFGEIFLFSTNPLHVTKAREIEIEIERKEALERAEYERKVRICVPIGKSLGDGERSDGDGGFWECQYAAEMLAQKLNDEQIKQLAEWLGVEIS